MDKKLEEIINMYNSWRAEDLRRKEEDAEKIVIRVGEKVVEIANDTTDEVKKAAAYRYEYEKLMSEKKVRTLTNDENGILRILKANIDAFDAERDKEFENLKNELALGKIENEEYYQYLAQLRDKYFEEGSSGWTKYTLEISQHNSDVINDQKKEMEKLFSDIDKKYDEQFKELLKKQESMKKNFENVSSLYDKVTIGGKNGGYSMLKLSDIDSELNMMKNYNASLIKLKGIVGDIFSKMGLDDKKSNDMESKFFEKITSMAVPDAAAFSSYLTRTDPKMLEGYLEKWVEKIDIGDSIADIFYNDEAKELAAEYAGEISDSFSSELYKKFEKLPDSFFNVGDSACESFKDGFISAIDSVMKDIASEVSLKIDKLIPSGGNSNITNNSSYNIYSQGSPMETALEIFRQEEKKRMLIGE